jgi:hypothetical protein
MIQEAQPETLGLANISGSMAPYLYVHVRQHLKNIPIALRNHKHCCYMITMKDIYLLKCRQRTMLIFPPRSSNKLQPLDAGAFKLFKIFYHVAVDNWLMQHPGQTFSIYNIAGCVNVSHQKAMTPANIVAAFHTMTILQKQPSSAALSRTDLIKCHKNKNLWQQMKQVKNKSL